MAGESTEDRILTEIRALMTLQEAHQRQNLELQTQSREALDSATEQMRQGRETLSDANSLMERSISTLEPIRQDLLKVSQALVLLYQKLVQMFRVRTQ